MHEKLECKDRFLNQPVAEQSKAAMEEQLGIHNSSNRRKMSSRQRRPRGRHSARIEATISAPDSVVPGFWVYRRYSSCRKVASRCNRLSINSECVAPFPGKGSWFESLVIELWCRIGWVGCVYMTGDKSVQYPLLCPQ